MFPSQSLRFTVLLVLVNDDFLIFPVKSFVVFTPTKACTNISERKINRRTRRDAINSNEMFDKDGDVAVRRTKYDKIDYQINDGNYPRYLEDVTNDAPLTFLKKQQNQKFNKYRASNDGNVLDYTYDEDGNEDGYGDFESESYNDCDLHPVTGSNRKGNYWSNPVGTRLNRSQFRDNSYHEENVGSNDNFRRSMYEVRPPSIASPPIRSDRIVNTSLRTSQKKRTTTFRSGTPSAPKPITEFYNSLFWYGFDPTSTYDENDNDNAYRTMFGGTKGKFNGLSYLYENEPIVPFKQQRQRKERTQKVSLRNQIDDDDNISYDSYDRDESESLHDYRNYERNEKVDDQYDESDIVDLDDDDDIPNDERISYRDFDKTTKRRRFGTNIDEKASINGYLRERRKSNTADSTASRQMIITPVTPPYDPPFPRTTRSSSTRRNSRSNDWVTNEVSTWFEPNNNKFGDEVFDNRINRRSSRGSKQDMIHSPRRAREMSRSISNADSDHSYDKPLIKAVANAFNIFMGVNRDELRTKAEWYNQRMGIPSSTLLSQSSKRTRLQQRRPGFSYRYNADDDDDFNENTIINRLPNDEKVHYDTTTRTEPGFKRDDDADSEPNIEPRQLPNALTWEERSIAMERVPPANVPAWGPAGDLGIDARTKALQDALEDIASAKQHVEERKRTLSKAKEELAILRVDTEIEKKRLLSFRQRYKRQYEIDDVEDYNKDDPNDSIAMHQQQLLVRQMERSIDDAARSVRYKQLQVQNAVDELQELQTRHWAVLRLYNPDLAEDVVTEAFQELEEQEPAIQSMRKKQQHQKSEVGDATETTTAEE